jgi:phosphoserine aminotransferase
MPEEALSTAAREMLSYGDAGMSVMEMSHRSKAYQDIFDGTEALVRELMHIPPSYAVLFIQGGATGQFAGIPMNLMTGSGRADYVDSGVFAHGAMVEAKKYGTVNCVASSRDEGYVRIPSLEASKFDPNADYFYITTNNTIYGTKYPALPETGSVPLVADMSSNILSEPYDVEKFGLIYAGAQKNIGPAGFALVIVKKALFGRALPITPSILNWEKEADKGSMLNTPPTFALYMAGLCLKWLKELGGVSAIERINIEKANFLYDALDESGFYRPVVSEKKFRSRMNATFNTPSPELDELFCKEAGKAGLSNLKGHRLVGGIRASIYNAMPVEGVRSLVEFMKKFETEHK